MAILKDRAPNMYVMHYDLTTWSVRSLILVPRFAFKLSAIERKKALGVNAQRAGWVGCYISLGAFLPETRIPIITDGKFAPPSSVRKQFERVRPFARVETHQRQWTLDVLSVVRSLNKKEFSLREIYSFEKWFAQLHPGNRHIRDKIRQVLRDMHIVRFLGHGRYSVR